MAKRKFEKIPGYIGVEKRASTYKDRKGKTLADVSFYVRITKDGKTKRHYVGCKSEKMTAARASIKRVELMAGDFSDMPAPRTGKTKAIDLKNETPGEFLNDETAIDELKKHPPEYWIFDRLYEAFVHFNGGENGYSNYKTDRGNYNNHIKRHVGHLMPQDIDDFKILAIRNQLTGKWVKNKGMVTSYETTKKRLDAEQIKYKAARKNTEKDRIKRNIDTLENTLDDKKKKIEANKKKLAPATIEKNIELIRRLANFGHKNGFCPGVPQTIKINDIDNEKTEDLTPEQIKNLWDALNNDQNRDVADMMKIALSTGLRRGSIFALTWKNINFQKETILIRGVSNRDRHSKSGRQIKLPMPPTAKQVFEQRAEIADTSFSPYVFPGKNGGRRTEVGPAARRIIQAAGLPDDFRPFHGQRHAFASNLANTGDVDLYQIGKLLGHSKNSPNQTQRYSHIRDEALKRASGLMSDIITAATANPAETADQGDQGGQETEKKAS